MLYTDNPNNSSQFYLFCPFNSKSYVYILLGIKFTQAGVSRLKFYATLCLFTNCITALYNE